MVTFAVEVVVGFQTKQQVVKLIRNGKCLFDKSEREIIQDGNLAPELDEMAATLEDIANNKPVPSGKCRNLTLPKKIRCNVLEIKSKHLRLYCFHEKHVGRILIIVGKKSDQPRDIKYITGIISEYQTFKA